MTPLRRMGRLIAATTTTALALGLAPVAAAQDVVEFSVSNITDFHGHLVEDGYNGYMGAALLAGLNDEINGDENIFTTSGDNVGGSAFVSAISDDRYTIDFLNAAGVDVSAAGNHEFDRGQDDLLGRIAGDSDFPILGANVYRADGERLLDSHRIIERDGVRIAFVGTVTEQTLNKVSPAGIAGLEFRDPVEETNKVARELREADAADVVIALMHEDAGAFIGDFDSRDVDFVFGGDSHVRSADENSNVPYAQSGQYGELLTDVNFTYNPATGELEVTEINQYDRDAAIALGATPNARVAGIVAEAQAQADALGAQVVATIGHSFSRGNNAGETEGNNRGAESTLNHLIAEAQRASMAAFTEQPVDIGLMNAGGVRQDLPAGPVTYKQIFDIQPFGNEVSYADLSGRAIINAIENQWKDPAGSRPRLALGLSDGLSYTYDPTRPAGERVLNVTLNGENLDPNLDYRVAASTFLLEGGDGFIDPAEVRNQVNVGYMDVQAFIDHLKANEDVSPRLQQGDIGVTVVGDLIAGQTVTVELTSLNYSNPSEPQAETAFVTLGDTTVSTAITTQFVADFNRMGEHGTATVELVVPEGEWTVADLLVTTDLAPAGGGKSPIDTGSTRKVASSAGSSRG
ncbi:bifunctional metallophosphatase/5'-nucleotidase [Corynebacterium comes]|uniref:Endonuclease YhcR n=1 Tax=Corynebacterium comes TaxID=2675218 RepID=A0A6B8VYE5_9CORY|nr:bifunctional UDP-sugar hydrolase/5'-nucleotidase [Corynebacterium comes]QGU04737.1 Endonuclease YhcR precursor [Corynebacterium comes]